LTDDPARRAARAAVVGLIAAVDIPIVHFSVIWWRGLHQGPTIGDPSKILNPSAPLQFVLALLAMLAAFTLVWVYLLIRRYQLARLEWQLEEDARRGRVAAARQVAVPSGVEEPAG
jgi:heme exporter protein C